MISHEYRYPIYHIGASWIQKNLDYNNGSGSTRMYREDPGYYGALEDAKEWWEEMIRTPRNRNKKEFSPPLIEIGVQLISLNVEFLGHETWCLSWFSHYTFNIHLTDVELDESFKNFVRRKEPLQRNLELMEEHRDLNLGTYCLMGAEDRYRWKGPCRCEDCKKFRLTRIDH